MKAILEFNLPDDKEEYEMTVSAMKYFTVIWEMKQELRKKIKYSELSEAEYEAYEKIQEFFVELLNTSDIGSQF